MGRFTGSALDKAVVTKYNVGKIGGYADRTYRKQEYNEAYTKLRTRLAMERMK